MKRWVLVFIANEPYIEKAITTILQARQVGEWRNDIVLLVSNTLYNDINIQKIATMLNIILKEIPERNFDSIYAEWDKHKDHSNYEYINSRRFIYNKFNIFDVYFKQWDIVFYLDAGSHILGPLQRIKNKCEPINCLYAHSDAYPEFNWKLKRQFCLELFTDKQKEKISNYNMECDYFQSIILIFDSSIIETTTVDQLCLLSQEFPFALRADQPIMNLLFTCERNLWKPLPIRDEFGYLFHAHQRTGHTATEYLILKWKYLEVYN